jgi:hypothetical protein
MPQAGKQSVSPKEYNEIGFKTKREGIQFAKDNDIDFGRGGTVRTRKRGFLSALKIAKQKSDDIDYIKNEIDYSAINDGPNNAKIGSLTIDNGTRYRNKSDQQMTLCLEPSAVQAIIEKAARGGRNMVQLIKLTVESGGKEREVWYTRNDEVARRLGQEAGELEYGYLQQDVVTSITIENMTIEELKRRRREAIRAAADRAADEAEGGAQKPKRGTYANAEGGFFRYRVRSDKEYHSSLRMIEDTLERYQIYFDDGRDNIDNCFVHAVKMSGVATDDEIQSLILKMTDPDNVKKSLVSDFAVTNKIKIILTHLSGEQYKNETYYPKGDRMIHVGLLEKHYFLHEKINMCLYGIKNYREVWREEKWWQITGRRANGSWIREKARVKTDSWKLIRAMLDNKDILQKINITSESLGLRNHNPIKDAELILDNSNEVEGYKPYKVFRRELDTDSDIPGLDLDVASAEGVDCLKGYTYNGKIRVNIGFDFESTTNTEVHKEYMVCYAIYVNGKKWKRLKVEGGKKKMEETPTWCIRGDDCSYLFLKDMSDKCDLVVKQTLDEFGIKVNDYGFRQLRKKFFSFTLLAHNLSYDMHFLVKHVMDYRPVLRSGTSVCGGSFMFYRSKYDTMMFELKDTCAIITMPLSKFKDIFRLEDGMGKEVMSYDLYTEESVRLATQPIALALEKLKPADHEQFLNNIKNWKLTTDDGEGFDHIMYAEIYCKRDVEVMMGGYFTFRGWVKKQLGIDIDDKLTISSIADEYFVNEGCYDGCMKINGVARYFIQKTVIGGRCMSASNHMYDIDKKLNDFDAVSLYPSAMKRLGEIGGYLKGVPKMIGEKNLNKKFLDRQDGYFIEVRIDRVRIRRKFPLISYVGVDGVRHFTNDVCDNDIFHFNKISFEDAIEYHGLKDGDYEIIKGYYFNEGRNSKIGESICKVFQMRLDKKAAKCPSETLYKLVMNSSYGKTIMKEQSHEIKYLNNEEYFMKFVLKNYNSVREITKLAGCDKYLIKVVKPMSDHFNACQIGSEILAMSKRIMNEVMTLAEDSGINIYYQDTDSMHIENDKVDLLARKFMKRHGRELVGTSMGQFHCDFEPCGALQAKCSVRTIILGKKSYYDKVYYGKDESGKPIYKDHFRMKGIPSDVVVKTAVGRSRELGCNPEWTDIESLYVAMSEGHAIYFNLLACGVKFEKTKAGNYRNRKTFMRGLSFQDRSREEVEDDDFYDEVTIEKSHKRVVK